MTAIVMLRGVAVAAGAAIWLALAGSFVHAAPVVFFGQDLAPGASVPPDGNAAAARDRFLARLAGGVGTESFEGAGFPAGLKAPLGLTFPGFAGPITATLTGDTAFVCNYAVNCQPPASGEFPASGLQWVATDTGMEIAFSSPVAAFGFFGTDIGDLGGRLTVTLKGAGPDRVLSAETATGASANGALLFWGFVDPIDGYDRIAFGNTRAGRDFFGFDDITLGDAGQVGIPEPVPLLMIAAGLAALLLRPCRGSLSWALLRNATNAGFGVPLQPSFPDRRARASC